VAPLSFIKTESHDPQKSTKDLSLLPGPPLRNQNPNLIEYLKLDRPIDFNEIIDEKKLEKEYTSIMSKIKELLKLTSPTCDDDEDCGDAPDDEESKRYEMDNDESTYVGKDDLVGLLR
jgi:hypothetical protein